VNAHDGAIAAMGGWEVEQVNFAVAAQGVAWQNFLIRRLGA